MNFRDCLSLVLLGLDSRGRYPEKILLEKISPEKIPLNAVEQEPVPTRVLNPNASEASYKPKQRSYRKTKLIFFFWIFFS